jgi:hypothetical protein
VGVPGMADRGAVAREGGGSGAGETFWFACARCWRPGGKLAYHMGCGAARSAMWQLVGRSPDGGRDVKCLVLSGQDLSKGLVEVGPRSVEDPA